MYKYTHVITYVLDDNYLLPVGIGGHSLAYLYLAYLAYLAPWALHLLLTFLLSLEEGTISLG